MPRILLATLLLMCGLTVATAQPAGGHRAGSFFDLAASASSGRFSAAASWARMFSFGKRQRLQVGYGLRLTSFVAAHQFYTTAPAKYTSTRQDIATIFSETIAANIDTLTTATAATYCLNATFNAQYRVTRHWDVGLNIDIAGVSFGPKEKFTVISSALDAHQQPVQYGSPTRFNLLLTSDNDIGSLNSEFFARYWITAKVGVRAGYTFLFSEYRTDHDLSFDHGRIVNDRYRHKAAMALLAVTYKPF